MKCSICQKGFIHDYDLINHMETIHNIYKCDLCDYYSKQKQHLKRHKLHKHNFVKCNHCIRKFATNELRIDHEQNDHQPLNCDFCDFYTRNTKCLLRHIKENHDSKSNHDVKRKTTKNDQEKNYVKRFKSSYYHGDIQRNEDITENTSDYGITYNQDSPYVGDSVINIQNSDTLLKINNSFPYIKNCWSELVEYRVKLLTVETTTLNKGESQIVSTNCMIDENMKLHMYLKRNKELNLVFEERLILPQKQTVTIKITNIDENVKIIPQNICVGYLIITH